MEDKPTRPRFSLGDIVKVAIVLACWIAGVILRFQAPPATYLGGGLLIIGFGLFAYWAKTSTKR